MLSAGRVFSFPWFGNKATSLQSKFNLPVPVAQSIVELSQKGYIFTVNFLQGVAAQPELQKLFTEGRMANAAAVGFRPETLENISKKLPFSIVIDNKTLDLKNKEKPTSAPSGPMPLERPSSPPPITPYVESPTARAEREIREARNIPLSQIAALQPQELINDLRTAWQKNDSLSFLISFIKLIRFSFSQSGEDVSIMMGYHELKVIDEARQGKDTAGFFLHFRSGTAGERWIFKSPSDQDKPYIVYLPSGPYDSSEIFKKALAGCSDFKVDRGKYLYLYLE